MKPFGVWHEGPTMGESDFFLGDSVDGGCCDHCINLYTADQLKQAKIEVLREAARRIGYADRATLYYMAQALKDGK